MKQALVMVSSSIGNSISFWFWRHLIFFFFNGYASSFRASIFTRSFRSRVDTKQCRRWFTKKEKALQWLGRSDTISREHGRVMSYGVGQSWDIKSPGMVPGLLSYSSVNIWPVHHFQLHWGFEAKVIDYIALFNGLLLGQESIMSCLINHPIVARGNVLMMPPKLLDLIVIFSVDFHPINEQTNAKSC